MQDRDMGRIRPYSGTLVELSRGLDSLLIIASLWVVSRWFNLPWNHLFTVLALFASLAFIVAASFYKLYRSWRSETLRVETAHILTCWCIAAALTGFVAYGISPYAVFPGELAGWWFIAAPAVLVATRVSVRLVLRIGRVRGHNYRRTAIVGTTHVAEHLAKTINDAPWMGLRLIGFYDDRNSSDLRVRPALRGQVKGNIDDLIKCAEAGEVDYVYIALPLRAELRINDLIDRLSELPISVHYVPDFLAFNLLHAQWIQVGNLHVINVVNPPVLGVSGLTKRIEDIVLSCLILAVIAIPMAIIALAIKLTSRGPVIFRQRRYGLDGKEFEIWKFRTMTVRENGAAFVQAVRDDARITRLGRLLRRTSLDELPQFINVLQGTMSIVGPRPHPVALDDRHRRLIPRYVLRHKIRPGITGLAQVNGFRGETDTLEKMQKRVESDIEYIDRWSLMLDFKIIFLTLLRGFTSKNAY